MLIVRIQYNINPCQTVQNRTFNFTVFLWYFNANLVCCLTSILLNRVFRTETDTHQYLRQRCQRFNLRRRHQFSGSDAVYCVRSTGHFGLWQQWLSFNLCSKLKQISCSTWQTFREGASGSSLHAPWHGGGEGHVGNRTCLPHWPDRSLRWLNMWVWRKM